MTTTTVTPLLPWQDRWFRPNLDQLLTPIAEQQRKAFRSLVDRISDYDHVEQSLVWHGPGWNWTIQFEVKDDAGSTLEVLCYLVPRHEGPEVCIPLKDDILEKLSLRRLHKFVRNGVRASKRSVEYYWATWNLAASSEADQLMELVKRKHKLTLEGHNVSRSKK